jgi:cobaltochelatase CobT
MKNGDNDQGRAEDIKRATANTLRAIGRRPDVQVTYQPGAAGLSGKRARLPSPSRTLAAPELAKLRGAADSIALRLRHHDDALHTARAPGTREAREAYDALEQARIEVLGAANMAGVHANLRGKLNEECQTDGLDRMTKRDQLPLATALSLLVRDKMDPEAIPDAARQILDLWRDTLPEQGQTALEELASARADQTAYTTAARKLLAALDMAEAESEGLDEQQSEDSEDGGEETAQQDNQESAEAESQSQEESLAAAQPDSMEGDAPQDASDDEGEGDDSGAATPRSATIPAPTAPSPAPMTRKSTPTSFATRKNLPACASSSTSSCSICTRSSPNSPTACSAACSPSKPAPGSSTWKKASWIPPASPASSPTRCWR